MGWRGIGPVQTSRRVQAQGGFTEGGWSSKNSTCCSSDSTWMLGPVPPSMTRHPELKMLGIGSNWENNFFSWPLLTVGLQLLQGKTSQEKNRYNSYLCEALLLSGIVLGCLMIWCVGYFLHGRGSERWSERISVSGVWTLVFFMPIEQQDWSGPNKSCLIKPACLVSLRWPSGAPKGSKVTLSRQSRGGEASLSTDLLVTPRWSSGAVQCPSGGISAISILRHQSFFSCHSEGNLKNNWKYFTPKSTFFSILSCFF